LTDATITIGLASLAVIVTIGLQALRATHYDDKLDKLKEKFLVWLQQIENELKAELRTIIAQASPDPSIDKIAEITSKFSAVKEMDQRVDELRVSNERSIRSSILVLLVVMVMAVAALFTSDLLEIGYEGLTAGAVWGGSIYYVHQFIGEYNTLCEKERKRKI
jgi:hypothetical protein